MSVTHARARARARAHTHTHTHTHTQRSVTTQHSINIITDNVYPIFAVSAENL